MHRGVREIEISRTRVDGAPWAVALNEAATTDEVRITLLALTVVDDVIRVSGIVRVVRRPDVKLSNVPALALATLDGPPLELLRAHVLPNERLVWISWTFERPADICAEYEGRIDHIDLAYRAGGIVREALTGPWVFTFSIPNESRPGGRSDRGDAVVEA